MLGGSTDCSSEGLEIDMQEILDFVRTAPGGLGLFAVFAAAALEYLVPPLPADTVVLAGALLVVAGVHGFATVAVVAIAGGQIGAAMHYALGRWLATPDGSVRGARYLEKVLGKDRIPRFLALVRRRGLWVIAVNRAFPGVRAVTFFAAGAARLPFGRTMAFGLVANVLWSLAVLSLGVSVGDNWEKIQEVFAVYKRVVYVVGGAGLLVFVVVRWIRSRRRVVGSASRSSEES
jgi:membrane protein DedA with SNARE-associated domain